MKDQKKRNPQRLRVSAGDNKKMDDNTKYIPEIIENLKKVDPYKIILFGSYVSDAFSEDSDIDLMVILDSDKIAGNYDDKMRNKLLVRRSIYELSKKVPVDLLVYTRAEYDMISSSGSSFHNEIESSGRVLYEKTN
ncbi:MAG: nucleotidyltransferase domain-containing protein [Deltaproteobacteria bacterium]|nr:nucleotidyltransferase domain-containing protein [Deltaproteobacteria bacterium]